MAETNADSVLSLFALYCGITEDEAEKYSPLCAAASAEISARKRENCGGEGESALCRCAAALAFYKKALIDAGCCKGSFSAGDIKVSESADNLPAARELFKETAAASAAYLKDDGFVFGVIGA